MRVGQYVKWKSLGPSEEVFAGTIKMFEHDKLKGKVVIEWEKHPEIWCIVARSRVIIPQPPASKTAKGGGDSPAGSAAVLAEVA